VEIKKVRAENSQQTGENESRDHPNSPSSQVHDSRDNDKTEQLRPRVKASSVIDHQLAVGRILLKKQKIANEEFTQKGSTLTSSVFWPLHAPSVKMRRDGD
jgi:hypothetical protein